MRVIVTACLTLVLLVSCQPPENVLSPKARALMWDFQDAYDRGRYLRALVLLDSALVLAPHYPRLHFLRGDVLSSLYRFEEADEAFARVLEIDPRYLGAAYSMGSNAFFVGQARRALKHYYREQKVLGAHAGFHQNQCGLGADWTGVREAWRSRQCAHGV